MVFGFKVEQSEIITDVVSFVPSVAFDSRGDIWTSFEQEAIETYLPNNLNFKHDKFSRSHYNVLRGIHGDEKSWKLVTCVYGRIFQVVVDLRQKSSSFGQWQSYDISRQNQHMVLIPPGFGNAYYVMSEAAVYHYKLAYEGDYLDADKQFSVHWQDPDLAIKWPVTTPLLSQRDEQAPNLQIVKARLTK